MIEIQVIQDLKEAEALWRALSPQRVIFDDWDFRYGFYKYEPYPLYFIAAYEAVDNKKEPVGLMPLQVSSDWGGKEMFAEEPCEENRVFVKSGYETLIKKLYESLHGQGKVKIYDISGEDEFTTGLKIEDYKYVLPLKGLNSFADFLKNRLSPKRRHSLEKELAAVEALEPEIILNNLSDLDTLFTLNINNFAEESYLPKEKEAWRELVASAKFDWRLTSLRHQGETIAASLAVLYQGNWHYLITGTSFKTYPGVGKYLNKVNIELAIKAGADYFDAGLGDCGWKLLWHFDKIAQYEFIQLK
ncbi:MAG: GNAT family N-acetyltransferase [Patescibacteria group bacterium]